MQVSEILRQLADLVDQEEGAEAQMPAQDDQVDQVAQVAPPEAVGADITVTHLEPVAIALDGTEDEPMVSPLQQQHELLKKATGVENNVDTFASEEGESAEVESLEEQPWASTEKDGSPLKRDEPEQPWASTEKDGSPLKDPGGHKAQGDDQGYNTELTAMKKMAGIGEEQECPHDHAQDLKPASLNPRANAALEANGKAHLQHTKRRNR